VLSSKSKLVVNILELKEVLKMKSYLLQIVTGYIFFCASSVLAGPIEDCAEYAKYGVPGTDGNILCRKGFLLAHDSYYKTPIWVVEHLTKDKANGTLKRKDNFKPDPDLNTGERAELSDYKGSGYDRGHMAPAADMKWDKAAMNECFYLSNMVPQVGPGMNQGIWSVLEEKVRQWALERNELYIFTGPVFEGEEVETIGSNEVAVPDKLYKIIFDPIKIKSIAFLMPNKAINTDDMPNYIVSIREVEDLTGLDFFPELEKNVQDMIETSKAPAIWQ
jgi:endonuclease G